MNINRREFIKKNTFAGLGLAIAPSVLNTGLQLKEKIRLGFIGLGARGLGGAGKGLIHLALIRNDVLVKAVCDIKEEAVKRAQKLVEEAGQPKPEAYSGNEDAYLKLVSRDDLDGIVIATPWLWHTPMAVASMKAGKYTAVEVPAATTIEACWDLVNTSEETGLPCMILENVCYRRDVMAILNMVRQGIFGELIHCQCGYQHDLRSVKFNPGVEFGPKAKSEAEWRTFHSINTNGDVYPTHGLGPVANWLDINRGNRFVSLTSMATKSRGLHEYIVKEAGEDHPNADIIFKLGDIVTTLIKCNNGETILISHDTNLPRPYSLGFRVQGTKGLWMHDGNNMYIEGVSQPHKWDRSGPYLNQYDHTLWVKYGEQAIGSGHGGMDFFVMNAFIESVKNKIQPPIDVYDAAAWSVVSQLSERSIANGGEPQDFPDFTRGMWMLRKPVFGLGDF